MYVIRIGPNLYGTAMAYYFGVQFPEYEVVYLSLCVVSTKLVTVMNWKTKYDSQSQELKIERYICYCLIVFLFTQICHSNTFKIKIKMNTFKNWKML